MKYSNYIQWLAVIAVCGLVIAISPDVVSAQCSMCRASLAGSNANFIRNFNLGVLVLLIPPVAMFCSFFVILRRQKDEGEDDR